MRSVGTGRTMVWTRLPRSRTRIDLYSQKSGEKIVRPSTCSSAEGHVSVSAYIVRNDADTARMIQDDLLDQAKQCNINRARGG